jgi:hypothetical protein
MPYPQAGGPPLVRLLSNTFNNYYELRPFNNVGSQNLEHIAEHYEHLHRIIGTLDEFDPQSTK